MSDAIAPETCHGLLEGSTLGSPFAQHVLVRNHRNYVESRRYAPQRAACRRACDATRERPPASTRSTPVDLDHDHASAVLFGCSSYEPPVEAFLAEARNEGLEGLALDDGGVDVDVPIPLVYEVEGWFRVLVSGSAARGVLLLELWGEAFGRDYGARVRLLGEPGLLVYVTPPAEASPAVGRERWARGVAQLSELIGRPLDPEALHRLFTGLWPDPLDGIWDALVNRY